MAAAVIQTLPELPECDGGKEHAEKKHGFSAVMPLGFTPLSAEAPQIKQHGNQRRQPDACDGGEREECNNARHQFTVGEQAADSDDHAGQRRPEGIAAEPLPVHGDACQGARQTLMLVSA